MFQLHHRQAKAMKGITLKRAIFKIDDGLLLRFDIPVANEC